MKGHRTQRMSFASVYPSHLAKVEKKGRTRTELDHVFRWLTGHRQPGWEEELSA